ncbi:non-ribosomal peptide synthase/polyketide synthase [Longimicrobium sp.]|uniref:non-ribosomal peptide synthase/polyketide synthase n=1 Tax=Longimicrobium sp. TaxID=2029185 RepID=UPI002C5B8514|nr:non-ribosomal peptide synthase/polyketide synthase [Longimicrobium sp.]HSU17580.1 non-ribosomal peptide synthase/polyketide synthase [Longimicrobium sp.]
MNIAELLERLADARVELGVDADQLVVRARGRKLDPALLGLLRENKEALLNVVRSGEYAAAAAPAAPLLELSPAEMELVAASVDGGAANLQDVYPLAPLQEGILFHHLMAEEGDPYLLSSVSTFATRAELEAYVAALRAVAARHDILRTAVVWEGLPEPVQVVWRQARLEVEEVEADASAGDVARQLWDRFDARHTRMDLRRAPLMRAYAARDGERWVLLLQQHHLTGDHVTFDLVREEVRAHLLGRQAELPAPLPFRTYVAQARQGVGRAEHEAYFRALLADVDEPTAPFGLADAWGDGSGIEEARLPVDRALAGRLRERARALGVSAASVCHVAWALVLARVSGRDDVVFGTVLFGRMQGGAGADRVLGPFINTLPVRVRVDADGAEAAVRAAHRQLAGLMRHEHASLALAQRCSGVQAPAPLFTSLLNYRHVGGGVRPSEAAGEGEGVRGMCAEERTNYPLALSVNDWGDGLGFSTQAPASVGPERVCAMMHRALDGLVEALETAPHRPAAAVDVLPPAERRQVVGEWNETEAEYPRTSCFHHLFEAQARRTPEAVALSFDGGTLTYGELNRRANRLAHHLIARGVGPDVRVALCVERGVEMVGAVLAVMKAGGGYVPLDPAYPRERLDYMLADSAPAVLLTQASLAARFAAAGVPALALDGDAEAWAGLSDEDPARADVGPGNLAYLIYTSGSTGRPKGVMVEHRGVANLVAAQACFEAAPESRVLQFASFSFDACVFEMAMALCRGAALHLPPRGAVLAGEALVELVAREGITHATLPPAVLAPLPEGVEMPSLRTLVLAGDAVPEALVKRWAPGRRMFNAYGPTEATVWSTVHACSAGEAGDPCIGRPVANHRVLVLDAAGRPAPVGVAGELCIGGVGVARGYLNRAALTAERFVPDAFSGTPGARLYRTGDLARWKESAVLEFLGRNDFQVKIRGFRIETGEIAARVAEHAGVREAAVLARADAGGGKRLVAYYVADAAIEADALRAFAAERLPEHMLPAAFVWLAAMPLTPNGKLDRRALPAPEGGAFARRGWEAPQGDVETALAEIWAEVLGVDRVGRNDHFFELGGHSLRAVQAISRVRQRLGADAALGDVFARPVLADFARELVTGPGAGLPPITPAAADERAALSFAQQRLWFLDRMEGAGAAYHIPMRLRLRGELNRRALVRALDRIVARHEALRTSFPEVDGVAAQRIAAVEDSPFHLLEHDLSADPQAETELRRIAAEEATAPFDLARGPVIRGRLVRLAADDHALLLTLHHIVGDGWSMGVLARELGALYDAFRRGDPDPLPPLSVHYADWAAWQRRRVGGDLLRQQADWWAETLAGAPELLELPADRPRPARQDFAGAVVPLELDAELTAAVVALGRRHGATPFMTLMAAWSVVLARLSGQADVVIGTPTANRARPEVEGLIGFFVNTLAVRVEMGDSPTVAGLLARVRERALAAQQHQDIPFEQVVERVRPARSLAHGPLFQVMFAWQSASGGGRERRSVDGLRAGPLGAAADHPTSRYDLTLSLAESDGRITGGMEYATALFDAATVERWLGYLRRVLQEMVADERQPVSRIPLLPEAERRQVLEGWNATDRDYPAGACVHGMFQAQARRTPDAVALSWRGERVTYAELDARANRLAHALRRRGVGPEVRVGVCLSRTPDLVVALLGVLAAGGAYVPLDPAYPRERLGWMMEDAEIPLVLTESHLADRLPEDAAALFLLDRERGALAAESSDAPESGAVPGNLSHVIFTSGSTGRPKGVMIRHAATVVLLHWLRENVTDAERASVLFSTSVNFDVSIAEVFGTLCWGGRLVLVENALELATLGEEVVYASMVPSAAAELLRGGSIPPCVRTLNLGGEALPNALAQGLYALGTVEKVGNLYGPTEDTTYSTYSLVPRGAAAVMVGRPVANTRAYVLDDHLQPVPRGAGGELYLAGDGLARGYAGRPAMTAERFVPCPFGPAGSRMYRVMDRVRWRPDGELEYLGRLDFQVKVRGFRIELGEIEARMAEHPAVGDAVVLAREDAPGDRRLVAYYTAAAAVEADALRTHLAARVPEYMVPAAYVRLDAFPQTPNGKVDRRALPAPGGDAFATREWEAPVGETEAVLAEIWAEVLRVERVGRWDHFFELGGHSLLAVQIASRVRQALGVEVPLGDLFTRPVLADFARGVETAGRAELPPVEPAERGDAMPLSFAQQRLWFLERLGSAGTAYHIPLRLRLRGELDGDAMRRALDRIVARHEALRTTFAEVDGEPVQRVAPAEAGAFRLVEHDLAGDEAALRRVMEEESAAAFDLERGPLVRGRLVRMAGDDHVLLVTLHHIVSDGWSMGVLTRELGALYDAFRRGDADPLPPLAVQYPDYAAWQRRRVDGEVLREQADYWARTLSGAPELLELPTDRPRPARQDHAGALAMFELDEELAAGLRALGRRHGTTLFMTLLAGWATTLARLSGQDDVVVGTPTANRGQREIEGLIGFFVNTLALRVELGDQPSVAQVLARVKERALEAQHHPDIPFEQVVERVQPARSLAHSPLFQVLFAWQNAPGGGGLQLPGLTLGSVSGASAGHVTAKFDLSLTMGERGARIGGGLEYATALFDAATVERYLGYFRRVLEAMVDDERQSVARIALLADAERRQVVEDWGRAAVAAPTGDCIHALFEAQAARTPHSVALMCGGEAVTYAELDTRANRLAHHLKDRGVSAESAVGVCLEWETELVVALLATLKAGGVYVPLDPSLPAERLSYMAEDAGLRALVTRGALADSIHADAIVRVDADAERIAAESPDALRSNVGPANLAYLIYTSGSTGRPKGVAVEHGPAAAHLSAMAGELGIDAEDRVLQFASAGFDVSLEQVFFPLLSGATLVLRGPELWSPAEFADRARSLGVTVANLPPAYWQELAPAAQADGGLAGIRLLLVGGDALPADAANAGAATRLLNCYGPTETVITATAFDVAGGISTPVAPIGRPLPGRTAYVLDAFGAPVPAGVAGELYLGGALVARGYLGRPSLTAERFVPDPFSDVPGARLYRTGDRVRWSARGDLEFLGRTDFQVKIRGFRIEPGEIEAQLREHAGVREAIVLAREDVAGDRRLVAYWSGDAVDAETLRSHLAARLPGYMVPAAYVRMDAFPVTANGKLDRRALPAPEGDAYATRAYESPAGEVETAIAAIWSELLGAERVGRRDQFFELGGHSLRAVQVVSRIREALGVEVPLGEVFVSPVLADFAAAVETAARADLSVIHPAERGAAMPLSFAQQRLWFLERLGGAGSAYHMPARIRLRGELDRAALVRALDRLVARHETLRTTFAEVEGEPVQRIAPAAESAFRLLEHDLAGHADAAAELRRVMAEEASAAFDLECGPLVRGRLVRVAEDDHVLLVTLHHIVSDGWSMGVLTHELGALYDAFRRGDADPLAPLPVQYADYAAWQRRRVDGPVLQRQADYWAAALAGAPELLELPTDRQRPARQDHAGAAVGIDLGDELSSAVIALGQRHGTTPFMTVLAAWAVVLARLSGQDDVVIGTPAANRGRREIEGLIGFFVNTLALRVDLSDSPTVVQLLARVKARALEAQDHQDIPFEQVVDLVQPARSLAHAPLFQVMFSWQSVEGGAPSLGGLRAGSMGDSGAHVTAKFDLTLALAESGGRIAGGAEFATALFDAATVERWLGHLRRVLEAMAADEHQSVARIALLADAERRQVVEDWGRAAVAAPTGACIHALFEAQAARTPDSVALMCGGEAVTYAELDARANRLAHHLKGRGVSAESAVGVCLEWETELVVALLATLKAGGVYVPLDPALPAERLAYMAEDAGLRALVTRGALAGAIHADAVVRVDADAARIAAESSDAPISAISRSNLAYLIYTSGSTGRPKGVAVEHGPAAAHLSAMAGELGIGAEDRVLQFASAGFDVSLEQVFFPLLSGATLVLRGPELWAPAEFAERARSLGVTVANLPPAYWQELAPAAQSDGGLAGIRLLLVGGDALPADAANAGAATRLLNCYGPTETVITATAFDARVGGISTPVAPIGRPLPGRTAYVLDAFGAPVPVGVAGELYLGGALVARGYLGRPSLTAERFVPDPFSDLPGARLYRTGDRVRWSARGELEFLGRTDFQVKIRGFRIEPGEIEARLREHADVRDAVVVAREDVAGDRRLVAYWAGDAVDAEALRSHLAARLPGYMVPAAYVRLDAFPVTPNGKLDRRALPAPEGDAFAARAYEAPLGETERAVAEIWAEVLGVERVGRWDSFFGLGGHSLRAVRVVSRIRAVLGVEAALGDLFERPVLADFARGLESAARADLPPIVPVDRTAAMPLSFAQQRLWFIERLGGAGTAYHIPLRMRLRGGVDADALRRALDRIVARHEALRTTFAEVAGEPVQRVAPIEDSAFRLVEHDLAGSSDASAELRRIGDEEGAALFDLEHGPLIRGRLVRMAEDDHLLLITLHHIVSDGWSMGVLRRELGALYDAFRRGDADPLPPLPVQYADYAAWQRKWVDGEVLREQAEYWTRTLSGAPELLELPADRPRPARQDRAGAMAGFGLSEELTAALKALSRRHGTTLYMTLLAGWAAVLARLSGQDDVTIGTPAANRGRSEIEGLIGFFVNTLALRIDLAGSPTVAGLLARVKERALGAQHHQDIPFEQVVERVQPSRSLAHTPLFQVMFSWQDAPEGDASPLPGLSAGSAGGATAQVTAKFDLSLSLTEIGGRIGGAVEYATALFDAATVERWMGYLRRTLEAMAADERQSVARIALLADAERHEVVEDWGRAAVAAPAGDCIHALFEAQAARTPHSVALMCGGEAVTYGELDARANRLAHHLKGRGVSAESAVGVCLEWETELVVALLATLKAGGVYVPLDPSLPAERLSYMAEDAGLRALVTRGALADSIHADAIVRVDADAERITAESSDAPRSAISPTNLAYLIYTSGSTGRPKGVAVEHGPAAAHLSAMAGELGIGAEDRVLQFASAGFDVSLEQVFFPLLSGATLVLRGPELWSPAEFAERARSLGITVANLPPAYWQELAPAAQAEGGLANIRLLLVGGDALPADAADAGAGTRLLNCYGPTETVITATAFDARAGDISTPVAPIGRPLPGRSAYVLDAFGAPVPTGVAGELYLGGALVARGYLGRPSLTAERFVPDPFSGIPGARLYRTGDRARWSARGDLEFLGRTDFQVKIRGFRIELGEIEARLREHPDVREAVVLAREDSPGDRRLVAYWAGDSLDAETLRSHLAARLPGYMVPAAYVRMDAFPVTANGKLDRRALPAPEGDAYATHAYEAPVGEVETAVAAIWAEVLGVERVGRRDSFFGLGGHSLRAVQVVSRIREALGAEVALGEVFVSPVLADFARTVQTAARAELAAIEPVERGGPLPLSFAQQRLWFLEQLGTAGAAYNVPTAMRLRGELHRAALLRALDRLVARHETLRTTFAEAAGEPVQYVAPAAESAFRLLDHDLADQADGAELRRVMAEEASAPFDLARGPLVRGRLVRLAEDDHVLLITLHHIISDGWSVGVLTRELGALYDAFRRGDADPLPPLALQYADYAAWQRQWVDGDVLREQAEYWTPTLSGAPELLELPTDHPRPARQDHAGAAVGIDLGDELSSAVMALGRRHGTTPFMTVLAAWTVVLSRLSGQRDVVVGTPTANRGRREIEGLIGFFVNTLALRIDLSDSPTAAELLARVKARALDAQEHQDIPFEQVVDLVQPARSLAHTPLFQAMFTWQNMPGGGEASLPGLRGGPMGGAAPQVTAKFDLSLTMGERGGRIVGGADFATALFDAATVERWLGYLRHVLAAMAADEHRRVDALPMLDADERRQLLQGWNATEMEYPSDACIHSLFEAQAERTPHAEAVADGAASLTYSELNRRANRLAHELRARGVGPDVRVGLCVERGVEMVVALFAVLKAGGAYVPLDPEYPEDRLRYMLADSRPAVLLTQARLASRFAGTGVDVVALDADAPRWADRPETNPERGGLRPGHLAYLIYTSGSTGQPKGVAITHRNAVNFLVWGAREFRDRGIGRTLLSTSLNFDLHVFEVYVPLSVGATVRVVRDALDLVHADVDATLVNTVPSAIKALVEAGRVPATVRTVNLAGEPLKQGLVERIFAETSVDRVCNLYGPSETTTYSTWVEMRREDGFAPHVGRPIANTQIYLLNADGEPVPAGVVGEMYIGGDGVARGYLDRPELTAERFVADPFASEPGARMYRTGDLARWLPDGNIEFLGRNDAQVKIRGFRIELGEIEARLARHPEVREAAVLAREDSPGDKRLVAYYVGEGVGAEALRTWLGGQLPEHMVPAAYVALETMPLTPNGKLDRKALPAPEGDAFGVRDYEAPLGQTERAVAEIWAEVLGVERVGRWDSFFGLGGHSLRAVRVISRIRQILGVEAALGDLFVHPVLAEFARGLESAARADLPPIVPVDRGSAMPLSFAQQRLWFIERLGGMGTAYHIPLRMRLRGGVDGDALRRALDRIVARHEALRTTFAEVDGQPVQRVTAIEESASRLVEHDLAGRADAMAELRRILDDESAAPFDLERGPLVRGRLVRVAEDDHVLAITLHHIVSDGWSMGVLTRELGALYDAFRRGDADPLPPLPVQYADYAAWQRKWVDGDVLHEQAEYWTRTLAGVPELLELPTDRPRPARQDHAGAMAGVDLGEELTAGLKELSRRHGTTLYMTVLAGWAAVLARLSGQDDIAIGTPTANRGRSEIEGLIGFFVNTLALRIDLAGSPSVAGLLGRVKETALGAQHHQDIPFEQVVERVQPARSLAHTPLFQVMFAWQDAPEGDASPLPGLRAGSAGGAAAAHVTAKFDLSLSLSEAGGRIAGGVEYATALFDAATIERWMGYLRRALEAMVADDARSVDALPLLAEAERTQLVETWNATAAEYPRDLCVHELFEAQAARTPHADAVVSEREAVTYAELNARANRLAHHLRALGVRPDARVAVCVERGTEMVAALLAVVKAGGAYVPLDPAYPDERLRYMLADSAPVALLTQTSLAPRFADAAVPVLDLGDAVAWADRDASNPARESAGLDAGHLAYVIYTSGSTGAPKGVQVEHRSLCNLVAWHCDAFGVREGDRSSSVAGFGFDAATWEIWPALCAGAALHLPAARDPEALLEWWARQPLDVSFLPTPLAELAFERGIAPKTLRSLLVGGDRLRTLPADAGYTVVNNYGPTETTVVATSGEMCAEDRLHIGRPISNTRVYVLDRRGEPVPAGVAGELYIGGAGVARGYLGRPGLTAERFVPDPFGGDASARMYKTGDLVRWLPDGNLEFIGRNDFQVKVRGFRIELGEIESRLAEHPDLRRAVVLAREDARLVAWYVADALIEAEALRAFVAGRLPEYMVPAAFVRLDALPLTPNGKVDRRALPAPEGDAFDSGAYEAPVGATEEALAAIWARVLGVERVGRHDSFFALGGHSLLAVQAAAKARQALGCEVALADLFAHPTLRAFAERLGGGAGETRGDRAIPIRAAGQQRPLFLVHEGTGSTDYAQVLHPHLPPDLPVYALPAAAAGEPRTVEGMAARLLRMVRAVQPEGPYRLAGWSFGGVLAYEMATQLIGMDQAVEFVGMMDTRCPSSTAARAASAADGTEPDHALLRAHLHALGEYFPQALPIPVHLFPAQGSADPDERRGWQALLPDRLLRVAPVPGSHLSMVEAKHVPALGQALSRALAAPAAGRATPEDGYAPLVTLRFGRAGGEPLFCVPGAGASVAGFAELAGCLDPSRPIHAFQPRGLDGGLLPHATVEAAAELYLRALHEVHPTGPVHLLGHSFGGWVVFEMALRLRAAGRTVGSLTILDSEVPGEEARDALEHDGREAFFRLVEVFEQTAERPLGILPAEVEALDEGGRLRVLHGRLVNLGILPRRSTHEVLRGPFRTFSTCLRATYRPVGSYQDKLRLVLVSDPGYDDAANHKRVAESVRGWTHWAPGLAFSMGAGNHMTALRRPHVQHLASLLALP